MVDFAGWQMPIQYPGGIIQEHLFTRKFCGLFDVSHMGRFEIAGSGSGEFLRYALTHDAGLLPTGRAHYTLLANEQGGAIDDAFLYRFFEDRRLLVVNAANKDKDWAHLKKIRKQFADVTMEDISDSIAMVALQGPESEKILTSLIEGGNLPEAKRNALGVVRIAGSEIWVGRTGYTGEPVCFELFMPVDAASKLWNRLIKRGARPVGLGARDTLRLEASLPLYGHEYGLDPAGKEIPIAACPTSKYGVSFKDENREFIGKEALAAQFDSLKNEDTTIVDKIVRPVRILDKGIARPGSKILYDGKEAGWLTSGTMVPFWIAQDRNGQRILTDEKGQHAIGLALLDRRIDIDDTVQIEVRGRLLDAKVVKNNLDNQSGPIAFAVME